MSTIDSKNECIEVAKKINFTLSSTWTLGLTLYLDTAVLMVAEV